MCSLTSRIFSQKSRKIQNAQVKGNGSSISGNKSRGYKCSKKFFKVEIVVQDAFQFRRATSIVIEKIIINLF